MDYFTILILLSFLWTIINVLKPRRRKPGGLPPGPHGLPIIGNILQLGTLPHQTFAKLSETYGPIISFRLGTKTVIVCSSSDTAKEVLQKHDQNFANRPVLDAARAINNHEHSMLWLPADAHWRFLRKICSTELFTVRRLEASQGLRQKKVQELHDYVLECSRTGQTVHIAEAGFTTSLNFISNSLFSIDLAHYDTRKSHEFMGLVRDLLEAIAKPNIVDCFPVLRLLDPQGVRRLTGFYLEKLLAILDDIVEKRLESMGNLSGKNNYNDMLNTLIKLHQENESEFTRKDLNHLLLDLFIGGSDTSSAALEWTMTELLKNPIVLTKAQAELKEVIGIGKDKMVQESDISRLPYLQAIVKEALRLHPIGPLLTHKSATETEIMGYTIPKDAPVFVNLWPIGRDPKVWPDPNAFMPERFLNSDIDFKGRNFELIPFGAGRRICPGLTLGYRMLHLMLASLIHSFDWKLEDGMRPEDIDLGEKSGVVVEKAVPLKAIPMSNFHL